MSRFKSEPASDGPIAFSKTPAATAKLTDAKFGYDGPDR